MHSNNYLTEFTKELESIETLVKTPDLMRRLAVTALSSALKQDLKHKAKTSLENSKRALENIEDQSIKRNYKIIYVQMGILAVSSLEATLKKYFKDKANDLQNLVKGNKKLKEIKVTALDLVNHKLSYEEDFGDLLLDKESSNFQNLKLIKDTFKYYYGQDVALENEAERKLIYYLELRHVLVHKSGKIDSRYINATEKMSANFGNYKLGDNVELTQEDWESIKDVFLVLVKAITQSA